VPKLARILVAVCAFFGVWLGVFFAGLILGLPAAVEWLLGPVALVLAAWAARRLWLRLGDAPPAGVFACMALGAAILGGAGFAIGFFGPMVWAPDANPAFAPRVIGDLIAVDLGDRKIACVRVAEIEAGNRRGRPHRVAFGQCDAGRRGGIEQVEQARLSRCVPGRPDNPAPGGCRDIFRRSDR
jgi:hypothetical protein